MRDILVAATIIVPLVMALTKVIKNELGSTKHLPAINCIAGIIIGLIFALTTNESMAIYGWAGLLSGLSAGGFYDLGKSYEKGEDK